MLVKIVVIAEIAESVKPFPPLVEKIDPGSRRIRIRPAGRQGRGRGKYGVRVIDQVDDIVPVPDKIVAAYRIGFLPDENKYGIRYW